MKRGTDTYAHDHATRMNRTKLYLNNPLRSVYHGAMLVSRRIPLALIVSVACVCAAGMIIRSVSAAGADANTLLLFHGDGKDGGTIMKDDSIYARSITSNSGVTTQKEESKFGFSSLFFNNHNMYITEASLYDLTGDFTMDLWFRLNTGYGEGSGLWAYLLTDLGGAFEFWIDAGVPKFTSSSISLTCSSILQTTTWYHLAVVRSGSTANLYVNGTSCAQDTSASGTIDVSTLYFGKFFFTLVGYMDEVRISNVARWTSDFTPPTEAYKGSIAFTGPVQVTGGASVTGTISKGSGTFAIDHPLDPKNKILYHSFVESPDVKNIYNGTVELDENGRADVELPSYFIALNKDFRYLATPLDGAMPNLHLAFPVDRSFFSGKIRFGLAGGTPHGRVSWQVTGVRHDPFIEMHPIHVEVPKGNESLLQQGECILESLCQ